MRLGPAGGFLLNKPGQWGHVALRKLKHILERIRIRQWIGEKARINVEYVTSCRDWKAWFLGSTTTSGVPNPAAPCHFLLRVINFRCSSREASKRIQAEFIPSSS